MYYGTMNEFVSGGRATATYEEMRRAIQRIGALRADYPSGDQ